MLLISDSLEFFELKLVMIVGRVIIPDFTKCPMLDSKEHCLTVSFVFLFGHQRELNSGLCI